MLVFAVSGCFPCLKVLHLKSMFWLEEWNVLSWCYFVFKFRDAINCLVVVIDVDMFLVLTKIMLRS